MKTIVSLLIFAIGFIGYPQEISTKQFKNNPHKTSELQDAPIFKTLEEAWSVDLKLEGMGQRDFGALHERPVWAGGTQILATKGLIFYITTGHVVCRDAFTGKEVWSKKDMRYFAYADPGNSIYKTSELGRSQKPAIVNDLLLVPTIIGKLHALNVFNGEEQWVYKGTKKPGTWSWADTRWISSPTVFEDKIFITEHWQLSVLDSKTGQLLWSNVSEYPLPGRNSVVIGEKHAFYTDDHKQVHAINLETGKEAWVRCPIPDSDLSPTLRFSGMTYYKGILLVATGHESSYHDGGQGKTYAMDEGTGQEIWHDINWNNAGLMQTGYPIASREGMVLAPGDRNGGLEISVNATFTLPYIRTTRKFKFIGSHQTKDPTQWNGLNRPHATTILGNQYLVPAFNEKGRFLVMDVRTGKQLLVIQPKDPDQFYGIYTPPCVYIPDVTKNEGWVYIAGGQSPKITAMKGKVVPYTDP